MGVGSGFGSVVGVGSGVGALDIGYLCVGVGTLSFSFCTMICENRKAYYCLAREV